jgi:hypothetical protein
MALSDRQIERYSRQIIVPEAGGIGQERLLAARVALVGEAGELEAVLAYLAGAGVGRIDLRIADKDASARIVARYESLNPDARLATTEALADDTTLMIAIAGSSSAMEQVAEFCRESWDAPLILVRTDTPPTLAVFPARPPCPVCASVGALRPFTTRAETAGFVVAAAAAEAFRTIVGRPSAARATLLEFDGYRPAVREIETHSEFADCACANVAHGRR